MDLVQIFILIEIVVIVYLTIDQKLNYITILEKMKQGSIHKVVIKKHKIRKVSILDFLYFSIFVQAVIFTNFRFSEDINNQIIIFKVFKENQDSMLGILTLLKVLIIQKPLQVEEILDFIFVIEEIFYLFRSVSLYFFFNKMVLVRVVNNSSHPYFSFIMNKRIIVVIVNLIIIFRSSTFRQRNQK